MNQNPLQNATPVSVTLTPAPLSGVYTSATCCTATSCADEQHVACCPQHVAHPHNNRLFSELVCAAFVAALVGGPSLHSRCYCSWLEAALFIKTPVDLIS